MNKAQSSDEILKCIFKSSITEYRNSLENIIEDIKSYITRKEKLGDNWRAYIELSKRVYDICMLYIEEKDDGRKVCNIRAEKNIENLNEILLAAKHEEFRKQIQLQISYYVNRSIFIELEEIKIIMENMIEKNNTDEVLNDYYLKISSFLDEDEEVIENNLNDFINDNFNNEVVKNVCSFRFNYNELNNRIQTNKRDFNMFFEQYGINPIDSMIELKELKDSDFTFENIQKQIDLIDNKILPFLNEM